MWSINKGKIGLQKIIYDCMTKDAQKKFTSANWGSREQQQGESVRILQRDSWDRERGRP